MKKIIAVFTAAVISVSMAVGSFTGSLGTKMVVDPVTVSAAGTSGQCGDNAYWELDGPTLKITGTGAMSGYLISTNTPWYSLRRQISSVVISEGITEIGGANFAGLSITSVSIPSSVVTTG